MVAEAGSAWVAPPSRRLLVLSLPLRRSSSAVRAVNLPAAAARWLAPTIPATRNRPADAVRLVLPTVRARAAGQGPEGSPRSARPPRAAPALPVRRRHQRPAPRSPHGPLRHATIPGEAAGSLLRWLRPSRGLRYVHGWRRKRVTTAGLAFVVFTENDLNPTCSHRRVPPVWNLAMRRGRSSGMTSRCGHPLPAWLAKPRVDFDRLTQRRAQPSAGQRIEHRSAGLVERDLGAAFVDRHPDVPPAAVLVPARHRPCLPVPLPSQPRKQGEQGYCARSSFHSASFRGCSACVVMRRVSGGCGGGRGCVAGRRSRHPGRREDGARSASAPRGSGAVVAPLGSGARAAARRRTTTRHRLQPRSPQEGAPLRPSRRSAAPLKCQRGSTVRGWT